MSGDNIERAAALLDRLDIAVDVQRKAALTVARNARDVEDCRLLLDVLGLLDSDGAA